MAIGLFQWSWLFWRVLGGQHVGCPTCQINLLIYSWIHSGLRRWTRVWPRWWCVPLLESHQRTDDVRLCPLGDAEWCSPISPLWLRSSLWDPHVGLDSTESPVHLIVLETSVASLAWIIYHRGGQALQSGGGSFFHSFHLYELQFPPSLSLKNHCRFMGLKKKMCYNLTLSLSIWALTWSHIEQRESFRSSSCIPCMWSQFAFGSLRCSGLLLYIFSSRPRINHFFKGSWHLERQLENKNTGVPGWLR